MEVVAAFMVAEDFTPVARSAEEARTAEEVRFAAVWGPTEAVASAARGHSAEELIAVVHLEEHAAMHPGAGRRVASDAVSARGAVMRAVGQVLVAASQTETSTPSAGREVLRVAFMAATPR